MHNLLHQYQRLAPRHCSLFQALTHTPSVQSLFLQTLYTPRHYLPKFFSVTRNPQIFPPLPIPRLPPLPSQPPPIQILISPQNSPAQSTPQAHPHTPPPPLSRTTFSRPFYIRPNRPNSPSSTCYTCYFRYSCYTYCCYTTTDSCSSHNLT